MPFAGISRKCSAPTMPERSSPCRCSEKPCGTFSVVQSLYSDPGVTASVERSTTCPENGSRCDIQSKAASIFSGGTFQATSAPSARLVASKVCRTRRIVPARNIAMIRLSTVSTGNPARSAISPNGSRTKPAILSSEMARMRALIGSLCSIGTVSLGKIFMRRRRRKRRENGRSCRRAQINARRNGCSDCVC